MIENRLNNLLFKWMGDSVPKMGSAVEKKYERLNKEVKEIILRNTEKMRFAQKVDLLASPK